MKEKFTVTGMTCTACSSGIERTVKKLDGVLSAEVSLMAESMVVEYDENKLSSKEIIGAVLSLGYGAKPYEEGVANTKKNAGKVLKIRFISSLVFLLPLMYFSMGHTMWGLPLPAFFEGNHIAVGLVGANIVCFIDKGMNVEINNIKILIFHKPSRRQLLSADKLILHDMLRSVNTSQKGVHDIFQNCK